ncbi:MAG: DEAD/DEAH box helicase [bacterium]|nr:DEAD/DEAH box helicase [bacterium]
MHSKHPQATTNLPTPTSFAGLGIAENFLAALTRQGFSTPTPIQHQAIPVAISGKDIIGIAQTGTGKTLAFGIPMIQRLGQSKGRGLVLLPTRELALQVDEVLRKISTTLGLRTAVLIGGAPMGPQLQALRSKPHVVVATPGRLLDHVQQKSIDLGLHTIVVLDEADRMLDMGFAPQIKRVLQALPRERQTMLFSATMPKEIVQLATQFMQLPLQIEVARTGTLVKNVEQEFFMVKKEDKLRLLDTLVARYLGTILVFSRTKHGAKRICRAISGMGHQVTELHSNRSLSQRRAAMEGFKSGKYRILVATDIAARGIDVQDIELVVNFDIPDDPEDYVHRIGRTARAGKTGRAVTFVAPDQRGQVRDIERLTRTTLTLSPSPELAPPRPMPLHPRFSPTRRPPFDGPARGGNRFGRARNARGMEHRPGDDGLYGRSQTSRPHGTSRRGRRVWQTEGQRARHRNPSR